MRILFLGSVHYVCDIYVLQTEETDIILRFPAPVYGDYAAGTGGADTVYFSHHADPAYTSGAVFLAEELQKIDCKFPHFLL